MSKGASRSGEKDPMASGTKRLYQASPAITWEEFEAEVKTVIEGSGSDLKDFNVESKKELSAADGTFEIDVVADFTAFGAEFKVLIECKRYTEAVKRDVVLAAYGKMQALGAQKCMVFSTSGFQKGAITYAKHHGIALVKLADGKVTYMTKSIDEPSYPSSVPRFASLLRADIGAFEWMCRENPSAFLDWLRTEDLGADGEPAPDETDDVDAPPKE